MYSVNGIPLDNDMLGWEMLAPSEPLSSLQFRRSRSNRPGRDGVAPAPGARGQTSLKFTVRTPYENLPTLLELFASPELKIRELARPGWTATAGLASSTPELHYPHPNLYSHSFIVEVPEGCWRGPSTTSPLVDAAPAGALVTAFPGISAPVQDAVVRIRGPIQDPQVLDSSGAWVALTGTIPAGQFVRFDSATGRAWLTTSDSWTGGTEVSGLIDYGGPRSVFEVTPKRDPADPRIRSGSITLTQASFNTGAAFQIRGAAAFLL